MYSINQGNLKHNVFTLLVERLYCALSVLNYTLAWHRSGLVILCIFHTDLSHGNVDNVNI